MIYLCDVIVLGAGASRSDCAPLQQELVKKFFELLESYNKLTQNDASLESAEISHIKRFVSRVQVEEIRKYFARFWNISLENYKTLDLDEFPSFEEVLGILDLAYLRKEFIKTRRDSYATYYTKRIEKIRTALKYLISFVIYKELEESKRINHDTLVEKILYTQIDKNGQTEIIENQKKVVIISLNYDILIDNAFLKKKVFPNYHVDFDLFFDPQREQGAGNHNLNDTIHSLFKIHGSLNWLYCPACHTTYYTAGVKGGLRILMESSKYPCEVCKSKHLEPVIIPPTFYKDLSRPFLQNMYLTLDKKLRDAENIYFCGYSFPDADIHLKYLFKRAEIYHTSNKIQNIFICNKPTPPKTEDCPQFSKENKKTSNPNKAETLRYQRFFRHSKIHPLGIDFKTFALKYPNVL